jgi:hypothetical protein
MERMIKIRNSKNGTKVGSRKVDPANRNRKKVERRPCKLEGERRKGDPADI